MIWEWLIILVLMVWGVAVIKGTTLIEVLLAACYCGLGVLVAEVILASEISGDLDITGEIIAHLTGWGLFFLGIGATTNKTWVGGRFVLLGIFLLFVVSIVCIKYGLTGHCLFTLGLILIGLVWCVLLGIYCWTDEPEQGKGKKAK